MENTRLKHPPDLFVREPGRAEFVYKVPGWLLPDRAGTRLSHNKSNSYFNPVFVHACIYFNILHFTFLHLLICLFTYSLLVIFHTSIHYSFIYSLSIVLIFVRRALFDYVLF